MHVILLSLPTPQHCKALLALGLESIYLLKGHIFFCTYISETLHNPFTETLQLNQQYELAVHNPNNQFSFAYHPLLTMHTHSEKSPWLRSQTIWTLEDFLITCAEVQIVQLLNRSRIHLAKKLTLLRWLIMCGNSVTIFKEIYIGWP